MDDIKRYRRTLQNLRARGRIKSETFGSMGQCQRRKGFTLSSEEAMEYFLKEFPVNNKSRDKTLKIVLKSMIAKDYIAAIEILSEALKD